MSAPAVARSSLDVPAGSRWPGRWRRVFVFGANRDTAVVALAGFLVRGGIFLLALPGVVLPSIIGVAGSVGISSFAIDGSPTTRLYMIVFGAIGATLVWLAAAGFVGAVVDVWLIEIAVDPDRPGGRERPLPGAGLLLDLVAVRGICLAPLAAALVWAGMRIYAAAYAELVTPSNLVVPIFVRVLEAASDAVAVVAVAWLATETVAAIAVRRLILGNEGPGRAIVGALGKLVRRPLTTLATVAAWMTVSIVTTAAAMAATAVTYSWALDVARYQVPMAVTLGLGPISTTRDFRPVAFAGAAILLAAMWLAGAAVSGVAAAWRSGAWTAEVADDLARRPSAAAESPRADEHREPPGA